MRHAWGERGLFGKREVKRRQEANIKNVIGET